MNSKRGQGKGPLIGGLALCVVILCVGLLWTEGQATGPLTLTDEQCGVCHPKQSTTIVQDGGLHKTAVGCQDCHTTHPPEGKNGIPQCATCHFGKDHYALSGCADCHGDTHSPLRLTLEGEQTDSCLTCHAAQGEEVKQHPSSHTELACNTCHEEHKAIPSCLDCHEKHESSMTLESCTTCHPVHKPLEVTYPKDTPSKYCGSCHQKASDLLVHNTSKHSDLECVFCHKDTHKTVPPCYACHAKPHPDSMLKKFSGCGECHSNAHDVRI